MVSTHLQNIQHISQNGSFPQGSGWKFQKIFELPPGRQLGCLKNRACHLAFQKATVFSWKKHVFVGFFDAPCSTQDSALIGMRCLRPHENERMPPKKEIPGGSWNPLNHRHKNFFHRHKVLEPPNAHFEDIEYFDCWSFGKQMEDMDISWIFFKQPKVPGYWIFDLYLLEKSPVTDSYKLSMKTVVVVYQVSNPPGISSNLQIWKLRDPGKSVTCQWPECKDMTKTLVFSR